MNHTTRLAFLLIPALLAGCASTSPVRGETTADPTLKRDIYGMVRILVMAKRCDQIDSVDTAVIEVSDDIAGNEKGRMVKGEIAERWTVAHCGTTSVFDITLMPDGKGGTFYSIKEHK